MRSRTSGGVCTSFEEFIHPHESSKPPLLDPCRPLHRCSASEVLVSGEVYCTLHSDIARVAGVSRPSQFWHCECCIVFSRELTGDRRDSNLRVPVRQYISSLLPISFSQLCKYKYDIIAKQPFLFRRNRKWAPCNRPRRCRRLTISHV